MDLVNWFLLLAFTALGGWLLGVRLGERGAASARVGLFVGVAMLIAWTFLVRHQGVAVQIIPVSVMSKLEGVGAVPWFMLVLGIAWARSTMRRQQIVIGWAMMLGAIFFVNGGRWMLQTTPTAVMGQSTARMVVMQSQDYSCVPAASATMLNLLRVPTTEARMAELTHTRPGTGSTTLRALDGLNQRLTNVGADFRAVLIEPGVDELRGVPLPAITPLQFEQGRRHMVTMTAFTRRGVAIHDPVEGAMLIGWDGFDRYFTGQVITHEPLDR